MGDGRGDAHPCSGASPCHVGACRDARAEQDISRASLVCVRRGWRLGDKDHAAAGKASHGIGASTKYISSASYSRSTHLVWTREVSSWELRPSRLVEDNADFTPGLLRINQAHREALIGEEGMEACTPHLYESFGEPSVLDFRGLTETWPKER